MNSLDDGRARRTTVLVGNPNTGKSVLFKNLTNSILAEVIDYECVGNEPHSPHLLELTGTKAIVANRVEKRT